MDAKTWLQKIKRIDCMIDRKLDEASHIRDALAKITAAYDGGRGSGSGDPDKIGAAIARLDELEAEIARQIDCYVDLKREMTRIIDKVQDPMSLALLYNRYVDYKTLEQCAVDMGFSYQWTCEIEKKAIEDVQKLLDSRGVMV